MITKSCDADISDRCLELDERVSAVVRVRRAGLAVGTEVGVMAYSTLEAITLDEALNAVVGIAERSVTVDAMVAGLAGV